MDHSRPKPASKRLAGRTAGPPHSCTRRGSRAAVKSRRRIVRAELRMIQRIVQLSAELEFEALLNGDILEHGDIPVVDAWPAQLRLRHGTESVHCRHAEDAGVEVARKRLVAR